MKIDHCHIVQFPKVSDSRGNLTFIEGNKHIPFSISRVYWLYDVPGGEQRGGHAHLRLHQLIIAASGSFDITVDDAVNRKKFHMNRSYFGLYVPSYIWREIDNFSSGAVCLVLASIDYDESEYIRDYDTFTTLHQELTND